MRFLTDVSRLSWNIVKVYKTFTEVMKEHVFTVVIQKTNKEQYGSYFKRFRLVPQSTNSHTGIGILRNGTEAEKIVFK